MKRKIISTVIGVLVAAAAVGTRLIALDTQSDLAPVADSSVVASLPVVSSNPLTVEVMDGLRFKLDTGSDVSCITASDLDRLRKMGVKIVKRTMPVFGRTSDGSFHGSLDRYVIDLPLTFITSTPDSSGTGVIKVPDPEHDSVLHDAEFVLVEGKDAVSAFGIDIIQRFAVEYLYNNRLIRLHSKRPDGYQDFSDFKASIWPSHSLWPGKRYYIDIEVDNITDSYFIDTGLRQAAVKLPASRAEQSRRRLDEDIIVSQLGVYPAKTNNVWVELGNRAGSQKAFYSDNDEEPYTVNPINVFTQDLLIDFPTRTVALRPYVPLPRQHFTGRVKADSLSTRKSKGFLKDDSTAIDPKP